MADYAPVDNRDLSHRLLEDKRERVLHSGRVEEHRRLTITDKDVGTVHFDSDRSCVYLIICSREYDQRVAFKFLEELKRDFLSRFSGDIDSARHSSLSRSANEAFQSLCQRYNNVENVDKVASVAMQVDEVKGVMQDNIQSVLRNQENIETLLDQTDTMKNEATGFQRSANRAKEKMWWKNVKLQIVIIVIVIVIIGAVIAGVVSKVTGSGSNSNSPPGPGAPASGDSPTSTFGNNTRTT